tara:strand:+ start:304 stop:615 length:312 start_codon:yes stop_codon:yes gene_type:complete
MSQTQTLGTHKTTITKELGVGTNEDYMVVRYWDTAIVRFNESHTILNTGGYDTATTKLRMNQASNQFNLGYRVYQKNFNWFVEYEGKTIPFNTECGMLLDTVK